MNNAIANITAALAVLNAIMIRLVGLENASLGCNGNYAALDAGDVADLAAARIAYDAAAADVGEAYDAAYNKAAYIARKYDDRRALETVEAMIKGVPMSANEVRLALESKYLDY